KEIAATGTVVDAKLADRIRGTALRTVRIKPYVTDEIEYLSADVEEDFTIAQANAVIDEQNHFVDDRVSARHGSRILVEMVDRVDYMDVSPKQVVSVATALIPFLEHDDANRAL